MRRIRAERWGRNMAVLLLVEISYKITGHRTTQVKLPLYVTRINKTPVEALVGLTFREIKRFC
jgi:hypothetical protein